MSGILGRLLCGIGRHKPRVVGGDGRCMFAVCERCGYYGLVDGYGNRS